MVVSTTRNARSVKASAQNARNRASAQSSTRAEENVEEEPAVPEKSARDKDLEDKLGVLRREREIIQAGSHRKYLEALQELERKRRTRIKAAQQHREYQLSNIEVIFEAETKQAKDEYEAEKLQLRDQLLRANREREKKLLANGKWVEDLPLMPLNIRKPRTRGSETDKLGDESKPIKRRRVGDSLAQSMQHALPGHEIQNDISSMLRGVDELKQAMIGGKEANAEVYSSRGSLYYYEQVFEKNQTVEVESRQGVRMEGIIVAINSKEVQIRTKDGSINRVYVSHLRSGKWNIVAVDE